MGKKREQGDSKTRLPWSPTPGMSFGDGYRLRWLVLAAAFSLALIGSQIWSGEPPSSPELSAEDLSAVEYLRGLRDVEVGPELLMSAGSPDRWILDIGFDVPEEDATWMISTEARLEFKPVEAAPNAIHLSVFPFVSDLMPTKTLVVETEAGVVEAELVGGGQVVSAPLLGKMDRQSVTLRCDGIVSPSELEIGSDVRRLCLKLISVRLSQ